MGSRVGVINGDCFANADLIGPREGHAVVGKTLQPYCIYHRKELRVHLVGRVSEIFKNMDGLIECIFCSCQQCYNVLHKAGE